MDKIYYTDVRTFNDIEVFEKHLNNLSVERRDKTLKQYFPKDRNLSLGAGVLLDFGLKQMGLREKDLVFEHNPYGKPIIKGGIHFNLAHSGIFALAAISEKPIGVDIEMIDSYITEPIQYMAPGEQRYLYSQDIAERRDSFIRLWCLKESFSKAVGLGLSLPLDAYEVLIQNEKISVIQNHDCYDYSFYEFTLPGYRAAICGIDLECRFPQEVILSDP